MSDLSEIVEQELENAVEVKDRKALHRYAVLVTQGVMQREEANQRFENLESDVQTIAQTMRDGFERMDRRFEAMDQRFDDLVHQMDERFEAVDKRFEAVDKRFEDLIHHMDKRFEAVDKHFDDVNRRFEDMNRRFAAMFRFMTLGFTVVTLVTVLVRFLV